MAYNFDNPMMEALLQHQQQALAYSPSMAAGTALKAVPEMAFDNPWATFLTALGTNLLGSGLTAYAGLRNQADTDEYTKQLGNIMNQGDAAGQAEALKATPDLAFLAEYPQLIEADRQRQLENTLNELTQKGKIELGFQKELEGYKQGMSLQNELKKLAVVDNKASQAQVNDFVKQANELTPSLITMDQFIDSKDPMADIAFRSAASQAYDKVGAIKGDPGWAAKLPIIGKMLSGEAALTPDDRKSIRDLIQTQQASLLTAAQYMQGGNQGIRMPRSIEIKSKPTPPPLPKKIPPGMKAQYSSSGKVRFVPIGK